MPNFPVKSATGRWRRICAVCCGSWAAPDFIFFPFGGLALFSILGPLIIWKTKGQSMPFAAEQAKESLNFQITVFLLGLLFALLILALIGFALLWILGVANLVLVIIAAIQVSDGKPYRYPFCLRLVK